MNPLWFSNVDVIAEERRKDFKREIKQLRLEREAASTKPRKPNWLVRRLHDLSVWIASKDRKVHDHYQERPSPSKEFQSFKVAK